MRRAFSWSGWVVLMALPSLYAVQIYLRQDLPQIEPWSWLALAAALLTIYLSRDRDEVLKHHVV